MTLGGFGMLLFFSTANTVMQTIVPDEMRGRVLGVWGFVFGAMIPLGSLEAGALANWLGAPFALAFGAVICAIAGLVALLVIRRREAERVCGGLTIADVNGALVHRERGFFHRFAVRRMSVHGSAEILGAAAEFHHRDAFRH